MLIQQDTQKTVTNVMDSTDFGIQNSGKMFKMVISGLYSKKAESITREIWSNAYDAHCMKGTPDRPFEITLPSTFRPEFKVRDFGEGLSHEWMKRNYTILGHSSKENTNIAVGKWGVGRMSPMSYTDTFSVVSIHKGMKTTYNVTMEGSGEPKLNVLVPPMETKEESGLEVSFPVAKSDYSSFLAAARRIALGFEVKPIVVGQKEFLWNNLIEATKGEGYSTYTFDGGRILSGVLAKMGCVIYPVNMSELDLDYSTRVLLGSMNILLDVPIGSVEVTASREDLSYGSKEPTKGYLRGKLMGIVASLLKDTRAGLEKCTNEYDAFKFVRDSGVPHQIKNKLKWKDRERISSNYTVPNFCETFARDYNKCVKRHMTTSTREVMQVFIAYRKGPKNDVRAESRVRAWSLANGKNNSNTLLVYCDWDKESKTYDESNVTAIEPYFGGALVSYLSTVPDVAPVTRKASKAKVYDAFWSDVEVDMDKGGYYFESYSSVVEGVHNSYKAMDYTKIPQFKDKVIIIAPKTLWKRFEKHDKWEKAVPALKKWVEDNLKGLQEVQALPYNVDNIGLAHHEKFFQGYLALFYKTIRETKSNFSGFNADQCKQLMEMAGYRDVGNKSSLAKAQDLQAVKDKVYETYPFLKQLYNTPESHKLEYILAMDAYRKK